MVNKKLVIGVVVAVVVLLALAVFTGRLGSFTGGVVSTPHCENVQVSYQEQEAYQEDEPYQAIEEYQVPLKYEVISATKGTTLHGLDVWATSDVEVRNVDSETGTFTVSQTFRTLNRAPKTMQSSQYIIPAEIKTFHEEFDIDLGEDFNVDYTVTPSEKTLTRTVTKYRTITKYRPVTKYRTEQRCT